MFRIVRKRELNPTVTFMSIDAPLVARKAKAGQFVILRVDELGERIPLTVAGYDREGGTVDIIFQVVGATTMKLNAKKEGESIEDFVGPLGNPTDIEGVKRACIVGGGVGCAIAYPVAKALHDMGAEVTSIVGFRNKDLVILEKEFEAASDRLYRMSDDGSWGGCCRLTLIDEDGKRTTKFACVDGPDFDAFKVDFDESMMRGRMYADFERHAREKECNLLKKAEVN